MVQDFAKIRPEPLLEKRPVQAPPALSLLVTGVVTGIAIGVFGCFLLYLSGMVPPLQGQTAARSAVAEPAPAAAPVSAADGQLAEESPAPAELKLDFYTELPNYVVEVDATPVAIEQSAATESVVAAAGGIMLQAGAFEQQVGADRLKERLLALGLETVVKVNITNGRPLYLVQSGPYSTSVQVGTAEAVLRSNNINYIPIAL